MAPKKPSKPKLKSKSDKGDLKAKSFAGGSGIFSQFEGAKYSNKRSWIQTPWPADFKRTMTGFDRQELTRKMRWLYVNAGLIRQIISDMALYSVGSGIKPQAASGNAAWDIAAEKYFNDWANKPCEVTGRYNYWEVQFMTSKLVDRDGELFFLKTFGKDKSPLLQVIESHRVGASMDVAQTGNGLFDGISFDQYGAVIGYNVIRSDGTTRMGPASSMMHVHHPEQVSGARAYSPLQHSILNCVDVMEIISLERVAMKVQADIVRTVTRENPQFDGSQSDFEAFGMRPADWPNKVYDNPAEVGTFIGGKTLMMAPGEELKMVESNRPAPNTIAAMEYLNRDSCLGTLPYEFVVEPNKAGAAMRLVVAKAGRMFANRQEILKNRLLIPTWGYVIAHAVANGDLPPNDNWTRVTWVTPKRVTVDAGKEEAATFKAIEMGLKSFSEYHAENGNDARDHNARRAADIRHSMDMAEEQNIPYWTMYKPSNTPNSEITATPDDDTPISDADVPMNEGNEPL